VTAPLLASFAAAGGAPPASHELVRVFRDGRVRALLATAWPGLGPVAEAGVYALELDAAALAELERLAADPQLARLPELDEPLQPGSGRYVLRLGEEDRRLRWDPFTTPPEPLATLAARLRALLGEAHSHPVAAVRLGLEAPSAAELVYTFTALGREPVTLTVPEGAVRARVVAAPEPPADPPPLAWVREAVPVTAEGGSAELAPGETWTLTATTTAPPPGLHRIDGFARVALDLAGSPDPAEAHLEATIGAGPIAVEVR
jgi:hypothetical protein